MFLYNQKLKQRARDLRNNATPQENKLWYGFLRTHPRRFLRQAIIGSYIVDFICHSQKLVIELDGQHHYTDVGKDYDAIRTNYLNGLGLHVLRFSNTEVDTSFQSVCNVIQQQLISR
ncbi:MAG: endonuclease domain-containing protein [Oscillospiraceae bacterium]|nr:endonuclease domain-containing protein [Oscillospiraceae bacterium]